MLVTGASSQNIEHLTSSSWWLVSERDVAGVFRLSDGRTGANGSVLAHLPHEQKDREHAEYTGKGLQGAGHQRCLVIVEHLNLEE